MREADSHLHSPINVSPEQRTVPLISTRAGMMQRCGSLIQYLTIPQSSGGCFGSTCHRGELDASQVLCC